MSSPWFSVTDSWEVQLWGSQEPPDLEDTAEQEACSSWYRSPSARASVPGDHRFSYNAGLLFSCAF